MVQELPNTGVFVLITTGKGESPACRTIARALFCAVPGSDLLGRGKRSLFSIISKSHSGHGGRICCVYTGEEGQCEIAFLSAGFEGSFEWLSPKILVKKIAFEAKGKHPRSGSLKISGAKSAALKKLIVVQESCDDAESDIRTGAKTLSILINGKRILEAEASYEG
jgi:hypothetical protein